MVRVSGIDTHSIVDILSTVNFTGRSTVKVPWQSLSELSDSFIDPEYLPASTVLSDPNKMRAGDLDAILTHWRERQDKHPQGPVLRFRAWKNSKLEIVIPETVKPKPSARRPKPQRRQATPGPSRACRQGPADNIASDEASAEESDGEESFSDLFKADLSTNEEEEPAKLSPKRKDKGKKKAQSPELTDDEAPPPPRKDKGKAADRGAAPSKARPTREVSHDDNPVPAGKSGPPKENAAPAVAAWEGGNMAVDISKALSKPRPKKKAANPSSPRPEVVPEGPVPKKAAKPVPGDSGTKGKAEQKAQKPSLTSKAEAGPSRKKRALVESNAEDDDEVIILPTPGECQPASP